MFLSVAVKCLLLQLLKSDLTLLSCCELTFCRKFFHAQRVYLGYICLQYSSLIISINHKYYDFSIFLFETFIVAPGQVLNLTVQRKGTDYRTAFVSWSPPAVRGHNGVLKSYLFLNNHTGVSFSIK